MVNHYTTCNEPNDRTIIQAITGRLIMLHELPTYPFPSRDTTSYSFAVRKEVTMVLLDGTDKGQAGRMEGEKGRGCGSACDKGRFTA